MKAMAATLVLMLCAGCTIANQASEWPNRYAKAGVSYDQLNSDGTACVPTHTKVQTMIGIVTFGVTTPIQGVAGAAANQSGEAMDACMAAKGYTVTR